MKTNLLPTYQDLREMFYPEYTFNESNKTIEWIDPIEKLPKLHENIAIILTTGMIGEGYRDIDRWDIESHYCKLEDIDYWIYSKEYNK